MAAKDGVAGADRGRDRRPRGSTALVMLAHYGLRPEDVIAELERREGLSGLDRKGPAQESGLIRWTDRPMHRTRGLSLLPDRPRRDPLQEGVRRRRDHRLPRHQSGGAGALPDRAQDAPGEPLRRRPRARRRCSARCSEWRVAWPVSRAADDGFRAVVNNGRVGRQEVYHLHIHVMGGPEPLRSGR